MGFIVLIAEHCLSVYLTLAVYDLTFSRITVIALHHSLRLLCQLEQWCVGTFMQEIHNYKPTDSSFYILHTVHATIQCTSRI